MSSTKQSPASTVKPVDDVHGEVHLGALAHDNARYRELEGRVALLEKYLRAVNLLPPADHVEPEDETGEEEQS